MNGFAVEKQLAAACMVHPYEASQILAVRDETRPNGIPSSEWLSRQFAFATQLHREVDVSCGRQR